MEREKNRREKNESSDFINFGWKNFGENSGNTFFLAAASFSALLAFSMSDVVVRHVSDEGSAHC